MSRTFITRLTLALLVLLASPFAAASYFRFYTEGRATVLQDELGLFGAATSVVDYTRVDFARTIVEFKIPDLSGNAGLATVEEGLIQILVFGRYLELPFSAANLELHYGGPGTFDLLGGALDVGPDLAGTFASSFRSGPFGSATGSDPAAYVQFVLQDRTRGLLTSLYMFESTRAATREIPDPTQIAIALPEPPTGLLLLPGLMLAYTLRRRPRPRI